MRKLKVGLFFHTHIKKVLGITKLVDGLISGFKLLGIPYAENQLADVNGCLQGGVPNYMKLPLDTLMGVNLMVLPSEHPEVWKRYSRFVTSTQWVLTKYRLFKETAGKPISLWAGGIDTDRFRPMNKDIKRDCFIYYKDVTKHVTESDLMRVQRELDSRGITHTTIKYGSYTESQLIELCRTSKFCVLMTGTESQGIAQMEIMSMNVPLYVFNQTFFKYCNFTMEGASSIPFFDVERCGTYVNNNSFDRFDLFMDKLDSYNPREYILENFTLKKCAQVYYDIVTGGKA